ncbi:VTC domain-containing protein [Peptoclostridium sp. AF21-18]|uniref:VTC domain-containing protein n=1 Tax=Peptoclostridium sp. AF21-18 TaxID=2292243 RepID=UPI000E467868|nr:VTC domain-containing protein [Peptoclostridium sp. AF21-18]RHQ96203.1 VTC domain-containing protein [Peptoclostridium sp. AF21-18]
MKKSLTYKNEIKKTFNINTTEILKRRLALFMDIENKEYIRDLYFDSPNNEDLIEKVNGESITEKFRIRYKNLDSTDIRLEKRMKKDGKYKKISAIITEEDVENILNGDIEYLAFSDKKILRDFYLNIMCEKIEPKAIIEFERQSFVYEKSDITVNIDTSRRVSLNEEDIMDDEIKSVVINEDTAVIEMRYNKNIPKFVDRLIFGEEEKEERRKSM